MTALRLAPQPVILLRQGAARRRAPPRPGRRAASPRPWARTTSRRCMPPTRWRPATGSVDRRRRRRIAAAAPAAIAELERLRRRLRPRRRRPLRARAWRPRTAAAASSMSTGDGTGAAIMRALVAAVRATPSITVRRGAARRAACWSTIACIAGVLAAGPSGAPACWRPAASCSPPAGWAVSTPHTTNPLGAIGQGVALAARAGAALGDMEFVQFHPTALARRARSRAAGRAKRCAARAPCWSTRPASASWRGSARRRARAARRRRARHRRRTSPPVTASSSMRGAALGAGFAGALPRHRGALPGRRHRSRAPADPGAAGGALPHGRHRRGRARAAARVAGPVGLRRGGGDRPARRQPAGQQLAARGGGDGARRGRQHRRRVVPAGCPRLGRSALPPRSRSLASLRALVSATLGVVRDRAGLDAAIARLQPLAFRGGGAADPAAGRRC